MKKLSALVLALLLCCSAALADVNPAADMDDYLGIWHAVTMDLSGVLLPMDEMGMSIMLTIADGTVTMTEGAGDEAIVTQGTAAVENGALVITFASQSPALVLHLHTDGILTYTETLTEGTTTICFEQMHETE